MSGFVKDSRPPMRSRIKAGVTAALVFALAELSRTWLFAVPWYRSSIQALPDVMRWLEQPVRWTVLCVLGVWFVHRLRLRQMPRELGLAAPVMPALRFGLIATLPMLIGGVLLGRSTLGEGPVLLVFYVGVWPLGEEILFRGYTFRQLYRRAGLGVWPAAVGTGLLFGMVHLGNTVVQNLPVAEQLGTVAVTGLGGILFAWLFARWGDNLWVPFSLHALMNLWWNVFDLADNPLGGWGPNVMRALTVILAIGLTLRRTCRPLDRPGDNTE